MFLELAEVLLLLRLVVVGGSLVFLRSMSGLIESILLEAWLLSEKVGLAEVVGVRSDPVVTCLHLQVYLEYLDWTRLCKTPPPPRHLSLHLRLRFRDYLDCQSRVRLRLRMSHHSEDGKAA